MQCEAPPAEAREDGTEEGTGPFRRCIVSRESLPKERLIRFVVDPQGALLADLEGQLPGRGLWLQARRDVVETACARGSFAKAARAAVKVPPGLAESIDHAAEQAQTGGHIHDRPGARNGVAFADRAVVTENHDTDIVGFQVQRHAPQSGARKLHHLAGHAILQTEHAGDTVTDGQHLSGLGDVGLGVERGDP